VHERRPFLRRRLAMCCFSAADGDLQRRARETPFLMVTRNARARARVCLCVCIVTGNASPVYGSSSRRQKSRQRRSSRRRPAKKQQMTSGSSR
jgi:hypothetical protein